VEEKMHFKLTTGLVLASLAVLFVIENAAVVEVRFLFWHLFMSLSLFVFLLFAIGVAIGWLLHSYLMYRRGSVTKKQIAV
jgi:uncharacterized integral membrane protein